MSTEKCQVPSPRGCPAGAGERTIEHRQSARKRSPLSTHQHTFRALPAIKCRAYQGGGHGCYTGCGKTPLACHSEESRSDRDDEESRIALKIFRARFLAPLGMTAWKRFSAACTAVRGSSVFVSVRQVVFDQNNVAWPCRPFEVFHDLL